MESQEQKFTVPGSAPDMYNPIPMGKLLAHHAERQGERECLVFEHKSYTWNELDRKANRLARYLQSQGVKKGDFVTIALRNGPRFFEAAFAALKLGATPNPVPYRLPAAEFTAVMGLVKPSFIFCDEAERAGDTPCILEHFDLPESVPEDPLTACVPQSWKALTSGGSTGAPKVIVSHMPGEWDPNFPLLEIPVDSAVLIPGPLYHNAPYAMAMLSLMKGNSVVQMPKFDAEACLKLIEKYRIEWTTMVPTMLNRIWRLDDETKDRYSLDSLRCILHTAAACPPWLKRAYIDWLGGERIFELYGGTEDTGRTLIDGNEWLERPESVGRMQPGFNVRILDENGETLPAGEIGMIYLLPDSGFASTYHYLGAERDHIGEWETLGDMGHLDEDGYLYLADRRTDLIVSGGANIYPAEVESAIERHPEVICAVAIGLPDNDLGQRVHAIVQIGESASTAALEDELRRFSADQIALYKTPRTYEFVTQKLRDEAGKVRRHALREERTGPTVNPA
jgi:bile acid-coenzyme A ligase